jgi:hypothetical protein
MRAPGVVKANPVANDPASMLQGLEPIPVHALLLQGPDHALDHAVLLWAVRRDEFLLDAIAAHLGRIATTGEDQTVIGAKQERRGYAAKRSIPGDQSLLQR